MCTPATLSRTMAPNTDTRANLIAWFTVEFGFSIPAATALHDVQVLKVLNLCTIFVVDVKVV